MNNQFPANDRELRQCFIHLFDAMTSGSYQSVIDWSWMLQQRAERLSGLSPQPVPEQCIVYDTENEDD